MRRVAVAVLAVVAALLSPAPAAQAVDPAPWTTLAKLGRHIDRPRVPLLWRLSA